MDFEAELSKFEKNSVEYKLFKKVFDKFEPDCTPKSAKETQREVHNKLCKVQDEYFQKRILANAIMESAEVFKTNPEGSSFIRSWYLSIAKNYLPAEESQRVKLFGLSREKVSKTLESLKSRSEFSTFKKCIEDNINDFCKQLIICTGGMILPGEDWQNAFERTIKEFDSKVNMVSSLTKMEQFRKKQLKEMIKTYFDELSRGILLLNRALSLTEGRLQLESEFAEFYLLRSHALSLKLKFNELKILLLTYNKKTVPALKKISLHLDQTEQKLTENCCEKMTALESYSKLGEDYERLVNEYADLVKNIKEQKWAIEELKSSESKYAESGCH